MTGRLHCACATVGSLGFVFVLHVIPSLATGGQDIVALEGSSAIERTLARGDEHRYALALTAGEYAEAVVEQRGIDVTVEVRGPDEGVIADFADDVRPRGEEHVEIAAGASGTYTITIAAGTGAVAGSYSARISGRRMASDADRAIQESRATRAAGTRLQRAGRFDEARPLFERALQLAEQVRSDDDEYVTAVVTDLAANALERRDNARAQSLYERALTVREKRLGPDDARTAIVRSRLGLLAQRAGNGPKAETLVRKALFALEASVGTEHAWYIRCLVTLSNIRDDAGDLEEAEALNRRALWIVERTKQSGTVLHADLLNNLGNVYRKLSDLSAAEYLFREALPLAERLRGAESYYTANVLQNLGIVARQRKAYAAAEEYYRRALAIREATVGSASAEVAQLLNNLGNIYHAKGDNASALESYLRALKIRETLGGPYDRSALTAVGNIARSYATAGDMANAIAYQRRAETIVEKQIALNLAVGSERQKLAFVRGVSERTDTTISFNLLNAPDNGNAAALAALVLLQRKGRVLDAMTDTLAAVRQRIGGEGEQELFDRLRDTSAQLARVALGGPERQRADERDISIADLEHRKEQLESELSAHSAAFRAEMQPVTLAAVKAALPADAALVEFAVFRPFDPKAERPAEAYGAPHYAAYVLRRYGPPRGVDLGSSGEIDRAIDALRHGLRDPRSTSIKDQARAVDELVVRPLRQLFGDATRLLISTDGNLNLVPFEALVDEKGSYLIERYATSYLTSGRDLLRMQTSHPNGTAPVIVADPLFGEPTSVNHRPTTTTTTVAAKRVMRTASALSTVYFPPLAATADEARAIKALFPDAALFTGRQATKATLQTLHAPRILHIASHGFFLHDAASDDAAEDGVPIGTRAMVASVSIANPLLRSGLALAGANLSRSAKDDGILTALEASGLNLWGTKLVTLSACDTGLGEVRNGEGVYGLRRAFVLAGTETLVMSLWPVSDSIARDTMVAYYTGLQAGVGRGDALREAKLAMLRRKARQHPFYWASFIQSGEWTPLGGTR